MGAEGFDLSVFIPALTESPQTINENIIEILLYYAREINNYTLMALNLLVTQQNKGKENTEKHITHLIN